MKKHSSIFFPLSIAIAAACWLLPSLGNGMLWEDEAQTALLARTTLRYGVPVAFDGPNSISQERGDDFGSHALWKWHMWLPFYVLAGFFRLFGESTAVARLPFALFGVATVVLTYFTSLQLWRDRKSAVLSSLLMLACIPFALLVRQCRYYSPAMFFSLLMLHAYLRIGSGSKHAWIVLAIAGVLLFNSHFIYCPVAFAAIALHAAIWHRDRFKPILLAALVTGILCAAPLWWVASLNYRNYHSVMTWETFCFQIQRYTRQTFRQILPYPLLLIPLAVGAKSAIQHRPILPSVKDLEPWALPIFFASITLMTIAPFSPYPFFRYLGPVIAPLLILVARSVVISFRANLFLGAAVTVVLALWWPQTQYLHELENRFVGPLEGIVPLLQTRGKPGDVVVASFEDLPIKFYTSYRVVGGNTGEDLSAGVNARWLIPCQVSTTEVRNLINSQLKTGNYKSIRLDAPDTEFENREEPDEHFFRSATDRPPVVMYERNAP